MDAFFTGKVYLVTGAASGIGLAIVALLLEYGAYVHALDTTEEMSQELAAQPQHKLFYHACDIRMAEKCMEAISSTIKTSGSIDGLVNCAAVCLQEGELPGADMYDATFDVNVRGAWSLATAAFEQMKKQGRGNVVNIGSLASSQGEGRLPIYTATKHALAGFTRTWALDFAKYGIRVNMVSPGPTDTPMVRRTLKKVMGPVFGLDKTEDELLDLVTKKIPLGRVGRPRESADAVAFFLSDFSSFVTGQVLVVGGGTGI